MQRTIVWIRHGKKAYANGKAFGRGKEHDPPITESENIRITALKEKLLTLHGEPSVIICSPFLRTRQTAVILNGRDDVSRIKVDENISEYLGHQKGEIDIDESTSFYTIAPLGESFESLNSRVAEHIKVHVLSFDNTKKPICPPKDEALEEKSVVVWIITHGIFISRVNDQLSSKLRIKSKEYYPGELNGLVVKMGHGRCTISTDIVKSLKFSSSSYNEIKQQSLNDVTVVQSTN